MVYKLLQICYYFGRSGNCYCKFPHIKDKLIEQESIFVNRITENSTKVEIPGLRGKVQEQIEDGLGEVRSNCMIV